TAADTAVYYCA
nr:immunoglobulin heavy chain junction region [Homo sapiens]